MTDDIGKPKGGTVDHEHIVQDFSLRGEQGGKLDTGLRQLRHILRQQPLQEMQPVIATQGNQRTGVIGMLNHGRGYRALMPFVNAWPSLRGYILA